VQVVINGEGEEKPKNIQIIWIFKDKFFWPKKSMRIFLNPRIQR